MAGGRIGEWWRLIQGLDYMFLVRGQGAGIGLCVGEGGLMSTM